MERPILEVCAGGIESALAAEAGGADRIELCAALELGGVTPGAGVLAEACARLTIPVVALVRPRRGDFLYDEAEIASMAREVDAARAAGARGVALGVLTPDGAVDGERTTRLIERARPMDVTFHRAFDRTRDLDEALEVLIELGVDRVLTSGGERDVVAGLPALTRLVRRAAGRIVVMPGGGVRAENAALLIARTGAREVHSSASGPVDGGMRFRRDLEPGEHTVVRTRVERVREIREALA